MAVASDRRRWTLTDIAAQFKLADALAADIADWLWEQEARPGRGTETVACHTRATSRRDRGVVMVFHAQS